MIFISDLREFYSLRNRNVSIELFKSESDCKDEGDKESKIGILG